MPFFASVISYFPIMIPITSASCECTFSKLTIAKSKLRSTCLQQRLEDLMIMYAENDLTDSIDISNVIDNSSMSTKRALF